MPAFAAGMMALTAFNASAEDRGYSTNNFGGIGLLEMRTARFSADGDIFFGLHHTGNLDRYFASWQATPWLETTLSYTDASSENLGVDRSLDVKIRLWKEGNYRPQLAIGVQDMLGDGRYAAEYLVASKRYYDFDFTLGLGWGYLGSRGGLDNMFRLFGDGFKGRETSASSGNFRTGSYFAGQEMAFFAGVEYHPPIEGLSFKAEYSGVDRRKYNDFSSYKRKTAFNVGVNYKPTPWASLALGYDHGDRVTFRLTLRQNLHKMNLRKWFKAPEPVPITVRRNQRAPENIAPEVLSNIADNDALFDQIGRLGAGVQGFLQEEGKVTLRLKPEGEEDVNPLVFLGAALEVYDHVLLEFMEPDGQVERYEAERTNIIGRGALEKYQQTDVYRREAEGHSEKVQGRNNQAHAALRHLKKEGLFPLGVEMTGAEVTVTKEIGPFSQEAQNVGRTARILTREMPDNIEVFTVASEEEGIQVSNISLLRKDFEKAKEYQSSPEEIWANSRLNTPGTMQKPVEGALGSGTAKVNYPLVTWGILPQVKTHFGGNEEGRFRYDLAAQLYGSVQLGQKLFLSGEFRQTLISDFDKIPQDETLNVPKVRSDISRYAQEGKSSLERLQLSYWQPLRHNLSARITGGLLEGMYAGISAELLYAPYRSDFSIGLEGNWVKQRAYDQLFSFRDYNTLTGHVTLYHENRPYNITSKLSAGRYLAGDYGVTLDVSRRFSNGILLGVWATYTDMSSEQFGEGSFDKGIYLTLPLEVFWYRPTTERTRFDFRGLGKNGGQKLDHQKRLYDIMSRGREKRLAEDWRNILN